MNDRRQRDILRLLAALIRTGRVAGMELPTLAQARAVERLRIPLPGARRGPRTRPGCAGCGVCGKCRSNARWNRIYAERFADPTYYASRPVRWDSSFPAPSDC